MFVESWATSIDYTLSISNWVPCRSAVPCAGCRARLGQGARATTPLHDKRPKTPTLSQHLTLLAVTETSDIAIVKRPDASFWCSGRDSRPAQHRHHLARGAWVSHLCGRKQFRKCFAERPTRLALSSKVVSERLDDFRPASAPTTHVETDNASIYTGGWCVITALVLSRPKPGAEHASGALVD